ncbi:MAG: hypothetical protein R3A79_30065 [Nannocystaceae bacterium]
MQRGELDAAAPADGAASAGAEARGGSSARRRGAAERLAPWIAAALVTLLGLWLVWPLPLGVMPMSADHTVHLTRAWLFGEQLAGGDLRGWSTTWFFGMPVGELYPPLGDLLVALLRALTFGQASWPAAYAWMVALVFVGQGLALVHAGVTVGRGRGGPIVGAAIGAIAGALVLVDPGTYREGGWIYTMLYGVWPQALATALAVLCLSEAVRGRQVAAPRAAQRHLVRAGIAGGLALLAHPMSLPSLALAAGLGLVLLPRAGASSSVASDTSTGAAARLRRRAAAIAEAAADLALVAGLAFLLAAWWLVPMLAHRGWMASYGWLHAPLAAMTTMAKGGAWAANMPSAVGYAVWLGLATVALRGPALARLLAAWGLAQWLLASSDAFWELRLDHLSAGFSHVQFQRFLIAAKPGLLLLAAIGIVGLATAGRSVWRSRLRAHVRAPVALVLGGALVVLSVGVLQGSRDAARRFTVGEVPTARFFHLAQALREGQEPPSPAAIADREAAYAELLAWLAARESARAQGGEPPYRIAFQAGRNEHWFMDSPLVTRTPTYKIGFTPGDNFVHKPEAASEALLDRLGVRYVIRERGRGRGAPAATFGPFTIYERDAWEGPAHIDGPGAVEVVEDALDQGRLRLRVTGADPSASRLVIHVGGYPRWELRQGGALLPWVETPAIAPARGAAPVADVTPAQRRAGLLRGGKADGDDGSEPTLIAAPIADGEVLLDYVRWRPRDLLALLLTLVGIVAAARLGRARAPLLPRLRALAVRALPLAVQLAAVAALLALLGVRWQRAAAEERVLASAWLADGRAQRGPETAAGALVEGPLKADMLIRPAIVAAPRRAGPAVALFPGVAVPAAGVIRGYVALDDDAAKQRRRGHHRIRVEARAASDDPAAPWRPRLDLRLAHRPGRTPLEVELGDLDAARVDLRVTIESTGEAPPPVGLNLDLSGGAEATP